VVIALSHQRDHARMKIVAQALLRANALFVQGRLAECVSVRCGTGRKS